MHGLMDVKIVDFSDLRKDPSTQKVITKGSLMHYLNSKESIKKELQQWKQIQLLQSRDLGPKNIYLNAIQRKRSNKSPIQRPTENQENNLNQLNSPSAANLLAKRQQAQGRSQQLASSEINFEQYLKEKLHEIGLRNKNNLKLQDRSQLSDNYLSLQQSQQNSSQMNLQNQQNQVVSQSQISYSGRHTKSIQDKINLIK